MYQHHVRFNYNRSIILGHGNYGIVFQGTLEKQIVAVKRTPLFCVTDLITKDEFLVRIRHSNVVLILHIMRDEDFRFTFMELCAASLDHKISGRYTGPMPTKEKVLMQLTNGLSYLHSLNILHGDIKPENILISSTEPIQMKWTGFGFRQLNNSVSLSISGQQLGSRIWWPPEMYEDEIKNASVKGEIFSAGCVFLYFLSDGHHPFGSLGLAGEIEIGGNVKIGRAVNLNDLSEIHLQFVKEMINFNPDERLPLWNVITYLEIHQRSISTIQFHANVSSSLEFEEKGYLNGHFSCGLFLSQSDRLAVKRIPLQYCSEKSYNELKQQNISNIVRILYFEKIGSNLFYGMEYCVASLDQCFPTKDREKIYKGPIPSHEQFFFQLVTALQFIHDKNLVHGAIKPSNILIYSEEDPQIKLSEFGLTFPRWNDNISSTDGFQSASYWMAPELNQTFLTFERKHSLSIFKPTTGSDIYSVGKVFFYYYCQTYAILNALQQNMFTRNQEYVFKEIPMLGYCKIRNENYPNQLFTEMMETGSLSRLQLKDVINRVISYQLTSKGELNRPKNNTSGNIQFSRDHILGKGGQAVVHLGLWKGSIAAIKRINTRIHRNPEVIRELTGLQYLNHSNVVKFFGYEKDNDFMYIAIEKCLISLNSYCRQRHLYFGVISMPSDKEVLLQMAKGLEYIHSQNLIHRDVKPGNILLSCDNPAKLKFADFGLSKSVQKESEAEEKFSFLQGTEGWMAPELIVNCKASKIEGAGQKCDIFALGCVFFYFLVPAYHPFGNNKVERIENILNGDPTHLKKLSARTSAYNIVIQGMIESDPEKRTDIEDVITKLEEVKPFEIEMTALTEASSRLSMSNQPNTKRKKII